MLQKMRDECKVNRFLAEKQPKMLSEKQQHAMQLRQILAQPNVTRDDVDALEKQLQAASADIVKLTEKKLKATEYVYNWRHVQLH